MKKFEDGPLVRSVVSRVSMAMGLKQNLSYGELVHEKSIFHACTKIVILRHYAFIFIFLRLLLHSAGNPSNRISTFYKMYTCAKIYNFLSAYSSIYSISVKPIIVGRYNNYVKLLHCLYLLLMMTTTNNNNNYKLLFIINYNIMR